MPNAWSNITWDTLTPINDDNSVRWVPTGDVIENPSPRSIYASALESFVHSESHSIPEDEAVVPNNAAILQGMREDLHRISAQLRQNGEARRAKKEVGFIPILECDCTCISMCEYDGEDATKCFGDKK